MDTLRRDLRAALVIMWRAPGFSLVALVTLALGIGAATGVFSVVHGVLLAPLPYPEPGRLVRVWEEYPGGVSPAGNRWLSRGTYAGWRVGARTIEAVGGYTLYEHRVGIGDDAARLYVSDISPAVLETLGARAIIGRLLVDADDREGAPRVVVLSERLWRERFRADPAVLGTSLVVDETPRTIVGVAAAGFGFPDPRVRLWTPYVIPRVATAPRGAAAFTALARMKPGVTPAQVEAEGTAIARAAPRHPATEFFFGKGGPVIVHARPFVDDLTMSIRPALSVMAVSVALVLLIACANVANLMLSRGVTRQRELAIRAAIGASRLRILRQLLTESAVFSLLGGGLGLLLAWWLVRLLPVVAPRQLPRLGEVTLDGSVMLFCALATLLATVVAGLAPAWRGARIDLSEAFRSPDGATGTGFRGAHARRLRDGLLVVEAAFAVILIVGASLLARSFVRLVEVDNGYTADGVLIAGVALPRDATPARQNQFIDGTLARLRAMPGVSVAGAGAMIPLMRQTAVLGLSFPEAIAGTKPTSGRALAYVVTPGYAEAIGLRLRQGRFFVDADVHAGALPTIVNEEFVRQYLSVGRVVGLRIPNMVQGAGGATVPDTEIVGIVANVLKDGNDAQPQPEVYFIHGGPGQRIGGEVSFVIHTSTPDPAAIAPDVRGLVRQVDPQAMVDRLGPLTTTLAASFDAPRFAAGVMGSFAIVAMVLAAIGLYGVLSYSVSQRVRELGIRAALGARRADLVRLVLREGLAVTLAGIACGVLAAALLTRLMQQLLFGVTPLDPIAFALAPAILVVASIAACLGPALRAASTDPAKTLRGP